MLRALLDLFGARSKPALPSVGPADSEDADAHNVGATYAKRFPGADWVRPALLGGRASRLARTGLTGAVLLLAACDNAFDPLAPPGPAFSVFGYLDATADTQWLRIKGVRGLLVSSADPTGYAAALQDLGTGQIIMLHDSAMRFVDMIGSGQTYAHDFWTAERLHPGASYRLRVQSGDSALTESVVQIPHDYSIEGWVYQGRIRSSYIAVEGAIKHMPYLVTHVSYYDACTQAGMYVRAYPIRPDTARQLVGAPPADPGPATCGPRTVTWKEVQVVASDAPWPAAYSIWALSRDSFPSNLVGGVGFIGGVLSKTIPIEDCYTPTTPGSYCRLRYDSTTATLHGMVTGTVLNDNVNISLQELDPPAGDVARTRYTVADGQGRYTIRALRPGIRHELIVSTGLCYYAVVDTLRFTAGRQTDYSAEARVTSRCLP